MYAIISSPRLLTDAALGKDFPNSLSSYAPSEKLVDDPISCSCSFTQLSKPESLSVTIALFKSIARKLKFPKNFKINIYIYKSEPKLLWKVILYNFPFKVVKQ
jgi:hypothetical protein